MPCQYTNNSNTVIDNIIPWLYLKYSKSNCLFFSPKVTQKIQITLFFLFFYFFIFTFFSGLNFAKQEVNVSDFSGPNNISV